MKKVQIKLVIVDQNNQLLNDLGVQEMVYNDNDIDVELELVHLSNGSPVVRPKTPPKY